jgi:CBS domain-containing protein
MGLTDMLESTAISEVHLRTPVCVGPTQTIAEVVQAMRAAHLGCVIIIDSDRKPLGMFTEGMLRELLVQNSRVVQNRIEDHMARRFPCLTASSPVEMILVAMQANNTRFICVLDESGRVVGLTGQKGLMEFVAECFPRQVMVQRIGGTPYPATREGA